MGALAMNSVVMKSGFASLLVFVPLFSVFAQNSDSCRGPVYSGKEVTRPAKITGPADWTPIYNAFGRAVQARVTVDAVLCRSGHVTDIKIVESSLPKINDFVVGVVSLIGFRPAETNYHTVSQKMRFEFNLNERSDEAQIDGARAAGRLIEELDVVGNRRLTFLQIRSWIKSHPGDTYNGDQIQRDLRTLLATGFFDALSTRVLLEDAARGGVRIVFEVRELPIIGQIKFEGLMIDPVVVADALKVIKFMRGDPYSPQLANSAIRTIKQTLDAKGQKYSNVEVQIENPNLQTVNVFVVITKP